MLSEKMDGISMLPDSGFNIFPALRFIKAKSDRKNMTRFILLFLFVGNNYWIYSISVRHNCTSALNEIFINLVLGGNSSQV